ncbi:putative RNA exonuclease pqe-1 isoform X2 [Episyrphus balteatus]|uniref:putative RNA exonuclease pqe-1 isoform X2 n=1 Tax=Episyrphus balteatus TaxID=286459 RepID=UPI002486384D|nr:putative RNA exonuclease pqe-1 isoform X2 [Episyrphus balteatus]
MDFMDINNITMIVVALAILGIATFFIRQRTKNDTLQRDRSKASHSTQRNNKNDKDNTKHDSKSDGLLTGKCQKHKSVKNVQKHHQKNNHKLHNLENNQNQNSNNYQKKSTATTRANDKEFDKLLTTKLNGIRDMDFASNGEYFASGTEESIIKRHNPIHRNSTASDLASTSDEVNSVSSHEDLSDTYDLVKVNKKTARARRNRKQRRQQQQQLQDQQISSSENHQQHQQQQNQQQSKKQNKNLSNSSSSVSSSSSSTPSTPNNCLFQQQQKSNKSSRRNGKTNNNNTATLQQQHQQQLQQQPISKTAKNLLLHSSVETPSSSATNSVSSSPTASPKAKRIGKIRHHLFESPLSLVDVLSEFEIASYLRQYVPDAKKLRNFGYPVESTVYAGCIEIYKSVPSFFPPRATATRHHHHHHNHHQNIGVVNSSDGLKSFTSPNRKLSSGDSGKGSGTSTPLSYNASPADSDYSEEENTAEMMYSQVVEKNCVRCRKPFKVTTSGEFITREPCNYHWGKQEAGEYMDEKGDSTSITFFSCCKKVPPEPCTQNHVHVWTDITSGLNGPYTDFVHTEPRRRMKKNFSEDEVKIYALDCEMSYTGFGMEVTKVTVVSYNGVPVYESIVHPRSEVGDYNTRFSGVSEKDFAPGSEARTLETVQNDLLDLIDADDILIGHALENDLRSLRIVHKRIVDTAIIYPHPNGFPFRRGLKSIVTAELGREIQVDEAGHSSLEDSLACLELMLLKVRSDWRAKSTKKAKSETQPIIPKSEQFVVISQHQSSALLHQKA